jgi:hypothetical protein
MAEPGNMDEYTARFHQNQRIEGYGLDTTMVMPCPFCAAPDFMRWKILEVESAMHRGGTCKECGRSTKAIFQRSPSGVQFEIVQTGGPDQPEWLAPKMRRVEEG